MSMLDQDVVEIPSEAFPFVVGFLSNQYPEAARAAVAAWQRMEREIEQRLEERRRAEVGA